MDRNYRFPRRPGLQNACCGKPTPATAEIPGGDPRCLCDRQPISLAMSYVMDQPFDSVYDPTKAWQTGTLFPSLDMPYCAGGRKR